MEIIFSPSAVDVEQWELSFIDKKHNERKEISFIVCHVHFPEEYWKKWGRGERRL